MRWKSSSFIWFSSTFKIIVIWTSISQILYSSVKYLSQFILKSETQTTPVALVSLSNTLQGYRVTVQTLVPRTPHCTANKCLIWAIVPKCLKPLVKTKTNIWGCLKLTFFILTAVEDLAFSIWAHALWMAYKKRWRLQCLLVYKCYNPLLWEQIHSSDNYVTKRR